MCYLENLLKNLHSFILLLILILVRILILLLLIPLTAIELSPGGSSPYTSTEKNINGTIQKIQYKNTEHSKYKYT